MPAEFRQHFHTVPVAQSTGPKWLGRRAQSLAAPRVDFHHASFQAFNGAQDMIGIVGVHHCGQAVGGVVGEGDGVVERIKRHQRCDGAKRLAAHQQALPLLRQHHHCRRKEVSRPLQPLAARQDSGPRGPRHPRHGIAPWTAAGHPPAAPSPRLPRGHRPRTGRRSPPAAHSQIGQRWRGGQTPAQWRCKSARCWRSTSPPPAGPPPAH